MRMDDRNALTARDIVNTYSENDLYRIIRDYGEDKFAKNIAKHIVAAEQQDYRYELYDVEEGTWLVPKVEILNIPKTVKLIDAYEGGSLNEGYCRGMQSFLMHLKKFRGNTQKC